MTRYPCILLFGQSNMDGHGLDSSFSPAAITDERFSNTAGAAAAIYDKIMMWSPFDPSGGWTSPNHPDPYPDCEGTFRALNLGVEPSTPATVNLRWRNNYVSRNQINTSPTNLVVGPEIPLCWNMAQEVEAQLHVVKFSLGGTWLTHSEVIAGGAEGTAKPLFDLEAHRSWHPSAKGELFDMWKATLTDGDYSNIKYSPSRVHSATTPNLTVTSPQFTYGAKTYMDAQGDSLDVRAVFGWLGDNDSVTPKRLDVVLHALRQVRKQMRQFLVDNDLTTLKAEEIPWIMAKSHDDAVLISGGQDVAGYDAVLDTFAADDDFTEAVDLGDLATNTGDPIHVTGAAMISAGDTLYAGYAAIKQRAYARQRVSDDSTPRLTLSEIRTAVLQTYEGKGSSNLNTTLVNQYINDAQEDIMDELGDSAWFLQRMETLTWTTSSVTQEVALPSKIRRIQRIEVSTTGVEILWKFLGFTNGGQHRIRILSGEGQSGSYNVYYIPEIAPMNDDNDMCSFPLRMKELIVAGTARRLAQFVGKNQAMAVFYERQEQRLLRKALKDMSRMDRSSITMRVKRHRYQGRSMTYPKGYT